MESMHGCRRSAKRPGTAALVLGLLMLAGSLTGCLSEDGADRVDVDAEDPSSPPEGADDGAEEARDAPEATNASDEAADANGPTEPAPVELHFAPGSSLSRTVPENASIPIEGGPTAVVADRPVLVFESEPLEQALVVEDQAAVADLWLKLDAPQPSTGEFDIVTWIGSTRGIHLATAHSFEEPVATQDETIHETFEVGFDDTRPFVVPAGERLVVHLTASQTGEEAKVEHLLVGGDTPSSVTLTARTLPGDPTRGLAEASAETLEGTVPGSLNPIECRMQEGVSSIMHPVEVPENASAMEFTLTGEDRWPHREDLDLHVHAEDGSIVLRTVSGGVNENMILAGPTLEGLHGSTLHAVVVACNDAAKDYTLDLRSIEAASLG